MTNGIAFAVVSMMLKGSKIGISTFGSESDVLPAELTPSDSAIREVISQVKQLPDANVSTEEPSAYVDLSLLGELRQAGFFQQMQRTYGVQ